MATKAVYATGRRKTASARVYMSPVSSGEASGAQITVNSRDLTSYFPHKLTQMIVLQPLEITERTSQYSFNIKVSGGGVSGQAGAVLHGIARALQLHEPELRGVLKQAGFLTRDPRAVERKKPGRHKARKRPQFSKR